MVKIVPEGSTQVASVQPLAKISEGNNIDKAVENTPTSGQSNGLEFMPDKRDIVPLGNIMYGKDGSSRNFIKAVKYDILLSQEELGIKILNDKLNASDTTDAQKAILESMLKDSQGRLEKLQKEQGVK